MTSIIASNQNITEASVWLYLTEKGRENKKKPFKYWMNNTELYFELCYVHPTHVLDVQTLLTDAYGSFLKSVQFVVYDNDKKRDMPFHYPAETSFTNPIIDDVNLITWTSSGWKIPFRCTICLPIDKVKYIQLFVNGWAVEFTLYAKASSKNKLDAGAPQLFPILGKMQRTALASAHGSQFGQSFATSDDPTYASDPFSTSDTTTPDYVSPDSTNFDPDHLDQLDPAVLDSPDFTYTTSDTFDNILSNFNPDQFEEEKRKAVGRVRVSRNPEYDLKPETKPEKPEKRRLQAREDETGVPSLHKQKKKEKKETTVLRKKKAKAGPKLLTAKKEGEKFTQYIPTTEFSKVKLERNDVPTGSNMPTGPTAMSHDGGMATSGGESGGMVIHSIILSPPRRPTDDDDDEFSILPPPRRSTDDGDDEFGDNNADENAANPVSVDTPELSNKQTLSSEEEKEVNVDDDASSGSTDSDSDDDDDESSSEESLAESESEDEQAKPVVLKRGPVKPAIDQIADKTGIDKEALAEVFKIEKNNGKPKENIAFIDELHKDLRINNFPLKYYNHILAFTDEYSVPSQRNFTFFIDKGNKMRFYKSPSIEIMHESLEFNLYVKDFGKPLVSHEQIMCVMSVDVAVQDKTGFIAIVPEHVGLVIIVPFAFNPQLYDNFKNPPKE